MCVLSAQLHVCVLPSYYVQWSYLFQPCISLTFGFIHVHFVPPCVQHSKRHFSILTSVWSWHSTLYVLLPNITGEDCEGGGGGTLFVVTVIVVITICPYHYRQQLASVGIQLLEKRFQNTPDVHEIHLLYLVGRRDYCGTS